MNGKQLADMAVDAIGESMRQQEIASGLASTVIRSIVRKAREIAERPDTPTTNYAGDDVKKVAEWTDEDGTLRYVLYIRDNKIVSVALAPRPATGRPRVNRQLNMLATGQLYEHFKPLMD